MIKTINKSNPKPLKSSLISIKQIACPAAIIHNGQIIQTNLSFDQLNLSHSAKNEIIKNCLASSRKTITIHLQDSFTKQSWRCHITPIQGQVNQQLIFLENITNELEILNVNALLYRLALILTSNENNLDNKLQGVVDQLLFEVNLFDCSIMLFNRQFGRVYPTAWGSIDSHSLISGQRSFALGEGVAGKAALLRRQIIIPNILYDKRFIHDSPKKTALTIACLPMIAKNELVGVITLTRPVDKQFSVKDLQLFTTIATRIATAIQDQLLSNRHEKQTQLRQIITASRGILDDYSQITDLISELLEVDQCFILHWDPITETINLKRKSAKEKFTPFDQKKVELFLKQPSNTAAILTQMAVKIGSATLFPLLVSHKINGFIYVRNTIWKQQLSSNDILIGNTIANQLAVALENAQYHQAALNEQKRLQQIQNTLHDGLILYTTDMKVAMVNTAAKRLLGVKREIAGQSWETILDKDVKKYCRYQLIRHFDPNEFARLALEEGKTSIGEATLTSRPVKTLSITIAPVYDRNNQVSGLLSHVHDISAQKSLEKAQAEFVATASHELRSPITAIVGYLSMLKNGDAGPIANSQQALFMEKAYLNAKRMVGLIENLLLTTRMEAKQIRYEQKPIKLRELIESVIGDVSFKAIEKGIAINCNYRHCGTVLADQDGLRQVITNLLNNGINYTKPNGKVTISFQKILDKNKSRQIIKITDNGVGIAKQDYKKIFAKFSRIENSQSINAGGTGLGLYITKSIVEELNGKIWLRSKLGQGSTFYVSLPLAEK